MQHEDEKTFMGVLGAGVRGGSRAHPCGLSAPSRARGPCPAGKLSTVIELLVRPAAVHAQPLRCFFMQVF